MRSNFKAAAAAQYTLACRLRDEAKHVPHCLHQRAAALCKRFCSFPHLAGHQFDWRRILFCWDCQKQGYNLCELCTCWHTVTSCLALHVQGVAAHAQPVQFVHCTCKPSNLSRFSAVRAGVAVLQLPRYTMVFQHHTLGLLPLLSSANTRLLLRHRSCAYSAFSNSTQRGRAITALAPKPSTAASVPQSTPTIHYSPDPLSRPLHRSPLEVQGRHCPQYCGFDKRQQPSPGQQVSVH